MQKLHKALDKQDFVFKTKKGVILKLRSQFFQDKK